MTGENLPFQFAPLPTEPKPVLIAELPAGIDTKRNLFGELAERLCFPDPYYGFGWHTMEKCLFDLDWLPPGRVILAHRSLPLAGDAAGRKRYLATLRDHLRNRRRLHRKEPVHDLVVVFPPDAEEEISRHLREVDSATEITTEAVWSEQEPSSFSMKVGPVVPMVDGRTIFGGFVPPGTDYISEGPGELMAFGKLVARLDLEGEVLPLYKPSFKRDKGMREVSTTTDGIYATIRALDLQELQLRRPSGDEPAWLRLACPCCGFLTILPHSRDVICPVCCWQYDWRQQRDLDYEGGVNRLSLRQARESFQRCGACEWRLVAQARKPRPDEVPPAEE